MVALLGKGGMGEVYRADDLKLGQTVALKFLPEGIASDPERLAPLLNEVRTARQVSHPNVCRVYDVGEVDGHHFISMEYVDGEDLASLLRRIGRLPRDKGVQIARQISAGLAAAHEAGVLHRDLKPANIMIDGRGRARITDFGLAALTEHLDGQEVRAGTPAYMAPELLSGKAASERSDLYALGLVLYEMFTGRPPFRAASAAALLQAQTTSSPVSPAGIVEGLDPAIDRAILRCLDPDPAGRPASALAVAAALPGGDPLAAAIAAGETPSPDLVAAAGSTGGMTPGRAAMLLAAGAIGLALVVLLAGRSRMIAYAPLDKAPAVLEEKAGQVLHDLGYSDQPADRLCAFESNSGYLEHLHHERPAPDRLAETFRRAQPAVVHFRCRQSPDELVRSGQGTIGNWFDDPAPIVPGMNDVTLDLRGRLVALRAVPEESVRAGGVAAATDWGPLLAAAGFEPASLTPVQPAHLPPVYADHLGAWEGSYPDSPGTRIRIEAASLLGRPVAFRIVEPWDTTADAITGAHHAGFLPTRIALTGAFLLVLGTGAVVASRNLRRGRGDRRGALRFAAYLGVSRLLWFLGAHHFRSDSEVGLLTAHMAWAAYRVGLVALFYLALEPYLRRLWPRMLVSWMRLLDGRLRDPLVGRDVLVGCLFGIAGALWSAGFVRVGGLQQHPILPEAPGLWTLESLRGLRHAVSSLNAIHSIQTMEMLYPMMLILLTRLVTRSTWAAIAVTSLVGFFIFYDAAESPVANLTGASIAMLLFWICLFRFGMLPFLVSATISEWLRQMPLTADLSAWYATPALLTLAVVVGVMLLSFRIALGGRPLLRDSLLDEAPAR